MRVCPLVMPGYMRNADLLVYLSILYCYVHYVAFVSDTTLNCYVHYVAFVSDTTLNCKLQFHGHHSYFRKDFQMLLTLKEGHM